MQTRKVAQKTLFFAGTLFELQRQLRHIVVDFLLFLHFIADTGVGVHHCGVVFAAKHLPMSFRLMLVSSRTKYMAI